MSWRDRAWKGWRWRRGYPFCWGRWVEIVSDFYVLCLIGDFCGFSGHSHMPTQCLQMREDMWETSIRSTPWGVNPHVEAPSEPTTEKVFLLNQTGRQTWQKTQKKERNWGPNVFLPKRPKAYSIKGPSLCKTLPWGSCPVERVRRGIQLETMGVPDVAGS